MSKTVTPKHLLPTDDLRHQIDKECQLTITVKNRGLHGLFYDLDGRTIVANYFPAQSLLNVHDGGVAKPTFQASGVSPDEIPALLKKNLEGDFKETNGEADRDPISSEPSERERDLVRRLVISMVANPKHDKTSAPELVARAREIATELLQ